MADADLEEWKATHGGQTEGYAGGGSAVAAATSKSDPRVTQGGILPKGDVDPDEPKPPADKTDIVAMGKWNKDLKAYRSKKTAGSQQAIADRLKSQ